VNLGQERAIALYHNAARRHEMVRDTDLRDLQDAFPALKPVFEEMQWLRDDLSALFQTL